LRCSWRTPPGTRTGGTSTSGSPRSQTTARGLANDRDVAQALATSDRATLERTATPGISFWRRGRLLAGDEPLPTGDEIGQQFEQFLAGLEGPDEQQG